MDASTFLARLQALSSFPEPLRQYAATTGGKLTDDGREKLMLKLEAEHADLVQLENRKNKRQEEMIEELVAFKKKNVDPLQKKIEAADKDKAESDLDAQLEDMKSPKSPKKKK